MFVRFFAVPAAPTPTGAPLLAQFMTVNSAGGSKPANATAASKISFNG